MLSFDPTHHHVTCRDDAQRTLWTAAVVLRDGRGEQVLRATSHGPTEFRGQAGAWPVTVALSQTAGGLDRVQVTVHPAPGRVLRQVMLRLQGSFAQAMTPQDVVDLTRRGSKAEAALVIVLSDATGQNTLLAGVGTPGDDVSRFIATADRLDAGFQIDRPLEQAQTYDLVFSHGSDPSALLDQYGAMLQPLARPVPAPLTGWNSWDYYGGALSMADVRQEMAAIAASPLRGRLDTLVLDMGWESVWGDWTPNAHFPASLREIASQIEAAGFVPGIWVAPLLAGMWAPLARHRQHLLARDRRGGLLLHQEKVILDFGCEETLDQLRQWFSDLRHAGFRVFKLDYIYREFIDLIVPTARHGRMGLMRRGLQAIRQAVGDDAHLINCGAPVEAALGIADSARMSLDIHTFWGHIRTIARHLAARSWQNGVLWRGDPDFALIRSSHTSDDPFPNFPHVTRPLTSKGPLWMAGPQAKHHELLAWLTLVRIVGGNVNLSDSIARLNAVGIDTLARLFPPLQSPGRPLDLLRHNPPRYWLNRGDRESWLAVFNWTDSPQSVLSPTIDHPWPDRGQDFWTQQTIRLHADTLMAPHSAYLLRID